MVTTNEIPIISVPIVHYRENNIPTEEEVDFKICRDQNRFRATPLMSKQERVTTGLPEELNFVTKASVIPPYCGCTAVADTGKSVESVKPVT